MLRRLYLRLINRLPRRHARRLQRLVMLLRPRARRRAAALAAMTPEARLMCVAWGVTHEQLGQLRDRLLAIGGSHPERMLVVSDCDALFGKGSCHFEYIPGRAEWERHFPDGDHDDFVRRRVEEIAEAFRARRVVLVGEATDPILYALAGKQPRSELEGPAEPAALPSGEEAGNGAGVEGTAPAVADAPRR
jgi:hypothetical protein